MKKVLFVATVVKTHINTFHLPFLKQFKDAGYETAVCAKNDFENPEDCVIPNCDKFFDMPFERNPLSLSNFKVYRKLRRHIMSTKYDIIHCHTPVGGILTRLAARGSGARVLYTAHGFHFFKGAPLKNWLLYYPAEWLCSFLTDTLITINREDFAFAKKHMHAKNIEYVPGVGIEISEYEKVIEDIAGKRREINIPSDATVLLSIGELNDNKNHETVIKAIKDMDVYYVIAGIGPNLEQLKALASEMGIENKVRFVGYTDDVAGVCAMSDIFVFPSYREGLSKALMEAMANGLPCVVSKVRGNVDLIDDGKGGKLFDPNNVAELRKAIEFIISSKENDMGAYNKEKIKKFDLDKILSKMKEIYR